MKKSKRLPIIYYDETLMLNFWFFLGWTPKATHDFCQQYFKYEPDEINFASKAGRCVEFANSKGGQAIAIWTKEKPKDVYYLGTLAHECVHACNMAFASRGIKLDFENDEPQAYLVAALFRKALNWKYTTHT